MTLEEIKKETEKMEAELNLEKLRAKVLKLRAENNKREEEISREKFSKQNNNKAEEKDYKEEFWKLHEDFLNNPEKILKDDNIKPRPMLHKAEDISEYLEDYGGQDVKITKEMYEEIKKMYKEILINKEIEKEKEVKPIINNNMSVEEAIDEILKL